VAAQQIHITVRFDLATGKTTLNEIVYRLLELRNPLMRAILGEILLWYDQWICERLTGGYPSTRRRGLGRHRQRGSPQGHLCRARKALKRGRKARHFVTALGRLKIPISVVQCKGCGLRYAPLLDAMGVSAYVRREGNFERQVIEAVSLTNYRRAELCNG